MPSGGYGYRWEAWIDRQSGELIDKFLNAKNRERTGMSWRRIAASGAVGDTLEIPSCHGGGTTAFSGFRGETEGKGSTNGAYPFTSGGGSAADGYGNMWCATAQSTFAVLVRIDKGDTVARSLVSIPALAASKAERDEKIASVQKMLASYETNNFDPSKVPNSKPGIASLAVDDDGRLWVKHAERIGTKSVTFDVHDRTGKHLGRVTIPQRASPEALPIRARGNDVWLAVLDDDDVVSLAKFRITR